MKSSACEVLWPVASIPNSIGLRLLLHRAISSGQAFQVSAFQILFLNDDFVLWLSGG
jgi:hypothetical protein